MPRRKPCGGIWGYPDFIQAIENTNHKRHEELLEWIGGPFNAEAFDPAAATKARWKLFWTYSVTASYSVSSFRFRS